MIDCKSKDNNNVNYLQLPYLHYFSAFILKSRL